MLRLGQATFGKSAGFSKAGFFSYRFVPKPAPFLAITVMGKTVGL
jgi:hypothetical protein